MNVDPHSRAGSLGRMSVPVGLLILYSAALFYRPGLTGLPRLEGAVGVLLGLYICSHPSANLVDAIFLEAAMPLKAYPPAG